MWRGEPCEILQEGVEEQEDALGRCLCRRLPTLLQQRRRGPVAGESVRDRPRARYYTAAAGAGVQSLREQILRVHGHDCSSQSRLGSLSAKFLWSKTYSDINHLGFTYVTNHPFHNRVDLNLPLKENVLEGQCRSKFGPISFTVAKTFHFVVVKSGQFEKKCWKIC